MLEILANAPQDSEDVLFTGRRFAEEVGDGAVINSCKPDHLDGADGAVAGFDVDERGPGNAKFLCDLLLAKAGVGPRVAQPLGQSGLVDGHGTAPGFFGWVG